MATYAAVADVGQSLLDLLEEGMTGPGNILADGDIELVSPAALGGNVTARLTLYLYSVSENGDLRNAPDRREGPTTVRPAPLALDLRYLLTAHPSTTGNDVTEQSRDQHRVLGRAMQILAENAVLSGAELTGDLSPEETIRISVLPTATDEVLNVWNTFDDTPYQPSVAYLVTPVLIDAGETEEVHPVVETEERYRVY